MWKEQVVKNVHMSSIVQNIFAILADVDPVLGG